MEEENKEQNQRQFPERLALLTVAGYLSCDMDEVIITNLSRNDALMFRDFLNNYRSRNSQVIWYSAKVELVADGRLNHFGLRDAEECRNKIPDRLSYNLKVKSRDNK